jgi:predicted nucleic acid-binding Zn ribbon protein
VKEKRRRPEGAQKLPRPESLKQVLSEYLDTKGLTRRVNQANAIDDWAEVVGPQIAKVTEALSITPDGTIFVAVTTNGWMTELSLMEPELVRALNSHAGAWRVRKIRFRLKG